MTEEKQVHQNKNEWLPRSWVRFTTVASFFWSILIGTYNATLGGGSVSTYGYAFALLLIGVGLKSLAADIFSKMKQ